MTPSLPWRRRLLGTADMASCLQVGRLLQTHIDGQLDDLTARRVARHLDACRRRGLEAGTYQAVKQSLARRGPRPIDPKAITRLQAFAADLTTPEPRQRPSGAGGA